MGFILGCFIGYSLPPIIFGLISYHLAVNARCYYIPLLIGVVIYILDSLLRVIILGFTIYYFVALCLAYLILFFFYRKCKRYE